MNDAERTNSEMPTRLRAWADKFEPNEWNLNADLRKAADTIESLQAAFDSCERAAREQAQHNLSLQAENRTLWDNLAMRDEELDRLQAEVERLKAELADERATHELTASQLREGS